MRRATGIHSEVPRNRIPERANRTVWMPIGELMATLQMALLTMLLVCGCGQRIVGFPLDRPDGGETDAGDGSVTDGGSDSGDGTLDDDGGGDGGTDTGDGSADAYLVDGGPLCGNNVIDPGEECDPPGQVLPCTTTCGTDGTRICLSNCVWDPYCTPPQETCNGVDDNCNGQVDEGLFGILVPPVRVTVSPGDSVAPAHVWTGSQFSLIWGDDRTPAGVYFNALSDNASILYGDTHLSGAGGGYDFTPDVDHTSTGTVAVWEASGEVYFTRFTQTGALTVDPPVLITPSAAAFRPSLATAGSSQHGVAWADARTGDLEIYFAVVDDNGNNLTGDVRVTSAPGNSINPSLVFTGSEFGLAWMDARTGNFEIFFARLAADGTKLGTDIQLTNDPHFSTSPALAWNGSEYALVWTDFLSNGQGIYFARISDLGLKLTQDLFVSHAFTVYTECSGARLLTWSGQFYGLVWEDIRFGSYDVFFTRLTDDGTKLDNDIPVTDDTMNSRCPYIRWNGSVFGIAFSDDRNGGAAGDAEIYFSILGCPP